MIEKEILFELEKAFWLGGGSFYEKKLADDAVLVFAEPVGRLSRDEAISEIASGPRWQEVSLQQREVRPVGSDSLMLTYHAEARREGMDEPYRAWVTSIYTRENGGWLLNLHQQTPDGEG